VLGHVTTILDIFDGMNGPDPDPRDLLVPVPEGDRTSVFPTGYAAPTAAQVTTWKAKPVEYREYPRTIFSSSAFCCGKRGLLYVYFPEQNNTFLWYVNQLMAH
jgi:hypothetical protein